MWLCSCGCINAGLLNGDCAAAKTWKHVEHSQVSENSLDAFRIQFAVWQLANEIKHLEERKVTQPMTPDEELFATYYNRGKILVKDMDDSTLREHREQLRKIVMEGKAHLQSADDEARERAAKKGSSKEWLVSVDTSVTVSDAINVPKQRKERMSKMDKIKQQLAAYLDEDKLNATVKALEAKATGANPNVETVILTKPSTEMTVIQVKKTPKPEPFDWSKVIKPK